jgi:hypothetical protein
MASSLSHAFDLAAVAPDVQTAIIAGAVAIVTATLTALGTTYAARVRIREVSLTYEHRLRENYLASARAYTNSIYVPLSLASARLSAAFEAFRNGLDSDNRTAADPVVDTFLTEMTAFLETIADLHGRGAEAFFTTSLESELLSFASFLRASRSATETRTSVVVEYRAGLGLPGLRASMARETRGVVAGAARLIPHLSLGILGIEASYRVERLIEAPITTRAFEERFIQDLATIREAVKEVTLGAAPKPT